MCLILVAWRQHPDFPFLVAANRDEFHARPTQGAGFWQDEPGILAGRDLEQGGTWLGLSLEGRFCALTNLREPERRNPNAPSRGWLVRDFLLASGTPPAFLDDRVLPRAQDFNGFNLLCFSQGELWLYCNREQSPQALPPGVYAVGNGPPHLPWAKAEATRQTLGRLVREPATALLGGMDRILSDRSVPEAPGEYPEVPVFLDDPVYGTRSSTTLLMDGAGRVDFRERVYGPAGCTRHERRFRFGTRPPIRGFPAAS